MGVKPKTIRDPDLANAIQSVLLFKLSRDGRPDKARRIVETIKDTIQEILAKKGRLVIENFGVFTVGYRAPYYHSGVITVRQGVVKRVENHYFPAKHIVRFTPARKLVKFINGDINGNSDPSV